MPRLGGSASSDGRRLSSALAHSSCSRVRHARFRDSMCSTLRAHLLHGETEVCTRAANRRVCSRALRASCPPLVSLVCGGSRAFGVPPARPLSVVCLSVGLGVRSSRVCIRPCVCLVVFIVSVTQCFHASMAKATSHQRPLRPGKRKFITPLVYFIMAVHLAFHLAGWYKQTNHARRAWIARTFEHSVLSVFSGPSCSKRAQSPVPPVPRGLSPQSRSVP